jgi:hypothetical protein
MLAEVVLDLQVDVFVLVADRDIGRLGQRLA